MPSDAKWALNGYRKYCKLQCKVDSTQQRINLKLVTDWKEGAGGCPVDKLVKAFASEV